MRQGANGVIHILSTMTHPCLHYEINEAWFEASSETEDKQQQQQQSADSKAAAPRSDREQARSPTASGGVATFGFVSSTASGYKLDGPYLATFPNSTVIQYNATYELGVRLSEALYDSTGRLLSQWRHSSCGGGGAAGAASQEACTSVYEMFDAATGAMRVQSHFEGRFVPRDLHLIKTNPAGYRITGLTAHGSACKWDASGRVTAGHVFASGMLDPKTPASCGVPGTSTASVRGKTDDAGAHQGSTERAQSTDALAGGELKFVRWQQTYGKVYASSADRDRALSNFLWNDWRIQQHNSQHAGVEAAAPWEMGHTQFSDLTDAEFTARVGIHGIGRRWLSSDREELLPGSSQGGTGVTGSPQVPDGGAVDWVTKGKVTPVKDQGHCGACVRVLVSLCPSSTVVARARGFNPL